VEAGMNSYEFRMPADTSEDELLRKIHLWGKKYYPESSSPSVERQILDDVIGLHFTGQGHGYAEVSKKLKKELDSFVEERRDLSGLTEKGKYARERLKSVDDDIKLTEDKINELERDFRMTNENIGLNRKKKSIDDAITQIENLAKKRALTPAEQANLPTLQVELGNIRAQLQKNEELLTDTHTITEKEVALLISRQKNRSIIDILKVHTRGSEAEVLAKLADRLKGVEHLKGPIARARASLDDVLRDPNFPNAPARKIFLIGPKGTGKTSIMQFIADELTEGNLIKMNMADFKEAHSVAQIKGPPPGYVGYGDPNMVTKSRANAVATLGLDEAARAHPGVDEYFLDPLQTGELTDSAGRTSNLKTTIVIATTNALEAEIEAGVYTVESSQKEIFDGLKNWIPDGRTTPRFSEPYLSRFQERGEFVILPPPTDSAKVDIMLGNMDSLKKALAGPETRMGLEVDRELSTYLVSKLPGGSLASREIIGIVDMEVGSKLLNLIRTGGSYQLKNGIRIRLKVPPGQILKGQTIRARYNEEWGVYFEIAP